MIHFIDGYTIYAQNNRNWYWSSIIFYKNNNMSVKEISQSQCPRGGFENYREY